MDGCHDVKLFFKIIFPIAKPVIVTMALIKAISCWNDFYMPMILLGNKNTTTLTLGIYRYVGQFTRYMSETMAAVVITLIPILVLYPGKFEDAQLKLFDKLKPNSYYRAFNII